jgi:hypothetical protein
MDENSIWRDTLCWSAQISPVQRQSSGLGIWGTHMLSLHAERHTCSTPHTHALREGEFDTLASRQP